MVETSLSVGDEAADQASGQHKSRPETEEKKNKSKKLEVSSMPADEELDQVDLDLVHKLRCLMEAEFEAQPDKYGPIHYEEIMDPESPLTCWRYIIHRDNKLDAAFELMKASLAWRKEFNVDNLDTSDMVKEFWHFTPLPFSGQTRDGHDLCYVLGKFYRKPDSKLKPHIQRFVALSLLGWDRRNNLNLKKMHLVFDVSETGFRNIDLDFMTWLLSVRDFVPARWQQFSVIGIPFIIKPIINLIISWLPENYKSIVYCGSFDKLVKEAIDDDNLPVEVGGTRDETYRLAPPDVSWMSDTEFFSDKEMVKALGHCFVGSLDEGRRAEMREMQLQYERGLSKEKN